MQDDLAAENDGLRKMGKVFPSHESGLGATEMRVVHVSFTPSGTLSLCFFGEYIFTKT